MPETLRALETVREQHAEIDRLIDSGELARARAALEAALSRPAEPRFTAEQIRLIRQDLFYRLAEVDLELSLPELALVAADSGLSLGRGEDVFTVNLLITEGRALESLHRDKDAAATYADAIAIDDALLEKALEHE
jgi:hypothetical protein